MTRSFQFEQLTKPQLLEVGEEFAVDLNEKSNKQMLIAELFECGVTPELYLKAHPELTEEPADEDEVVEAPVAETPKKSRRVAQILLRMQRDNPTYEVYGYRFTREHPFALVDEDDADNIIENNEGFRQATPKEAAEYYS